MSLRNPPPRPARPPFLFPRLRSLPLALSLTVALGAALAPQAHAHRTWLLPSGTVLSGDEPWVTVDAAVSNDLFYFEHFPLRLDGLGVTGPDGKPVKVENAATGRYRSTFDVKLATPGTYRITIKNDGLFASFRVNGEAKRLRGTAETLRKELPANAENLSVTRNQGLIEAFVTAGKPNQTALAPRGDGLEMVPVTHPNDLFVGDEASFRLVFDGKPAVGVPVAVIPGGIRYRDQLGEMKVVTDASGEFRVKWPTPGMYWINASYPVRAERPAPTGGTIDAPVRRGSYVATVEVLPQ